MDRFVVKMAKPNMSPVGKNKLGGETPKKAKAKTVVASRKTPAKTKKVVIASRIIVKKVKPAAVVSVARNNAKEAIGVDALPRISKKLTLANLKEEAACRGLLPKALPKTKAELLHHLGDGSIYVKETKVYKDYRALLRQIESEKESLRAKSLENLKAEEANSQARYDKRQAKIEDERRTARQAEMALQESLHTHPYPKLHPHPLADTKSLQLHGGARTNAAVCSNTNCVSSGHNSDDWCGYSYYTTPVVFTCEKCDWDICKDCFSAETMTAAEKAAEARRLKKQEQDNRVAAAKREREREEERQREEELWEEENKQEEKRWDATQQFKTSIIRPTAKNKTLVGAGPTTSTATGYVVWCSSGYGNDGWHSYGEPPEKEFDTIWKTAKDANDRARYLFYWKNCYGLEPAEFCGSNGDGGLASETETHGLKMFSVTPEDSQCWTVCVVPAAAYPHLSNSTTSRHCHDEDEDEDETNCYYL
jgi:hypothetical protein